MGLDVLLRASLAIVASTRLMGASYLLITLRRSLLSRVGVRHLVDRVKRSYTVANTRVLMILKRRCSSWWAALFNSCVDSWCTALFVAVRT